MWNGQTYKFLAMPQGLNCAPQKFTKCLKPAYSMLRERGFMSVYYIDDSFLVAQTRGKCEANVLATADLFNKLGFTIHPSKSVFRPTHRIQFLGFILDSTQMTVSLPGDKSALIKTACNELIHANQPTIRHAAEVIGLLVASFPRVERGPLFFRDLEHDKITALKMARGNFDGPIDLSAGAISDLQWWVDSVESEKRRITHGTPSLTIESDASTRGWGCCIKDSDIKTGGEWSPQENCMHINYLELKAAFLGFCREGNCHVRMMLDNTTAVAYIREMGGSRSPDCNRIARDLWQWALSKDIWITPCHLPGTMNVVADRESRVFHKETEWKLDAEVLGQALKQLKIKPSIDLFASRTNFQFKQYVSWRPDPEAVHVDAFTMCWTDITFYAFPPFSLIPRVLQKIREDRATGILVVPRWSTQSWFPVLLAMLTSDPYVGRKSRHLLYLATRPSEVHPMAGRLDLLLCPVSGTV
jgi:hypothetical protein